MLADMTTLFNIVTISGSSPPSCSLSSSSGSSQSFPRSESSLVDGLQDVSSLFSLLVGPPISITY